MLLENYIMRVRIVEKAKETVSDEIKAQKSKVKEQPQAVAIALSKKERGEINEMMPVVADAEIVDRFRAIITGSGRDMGAVLNLFMEAWNDINTDTFRQPDDVMNKE